MGSKWCAAGRVQLLWMELLMVVVVVVEVLVAGSHDRAPCNPIAVHAGVLLVIS